MEEVVNEVANSAKKSTFPSLTEFMDTLSKCLDRRSYLAKCYSSIPYKARPYRIRRLLICCDIETGNIFINVKNEEDNEEYETLELTKEFYEEYIFYFIRFFHPEELRLFLVDVAGFINCHLPAWWKRGITKLYLLSKDNVWINDNGGVVPAIETFPDLHSFGAKRTKIRLNTVLQFLMTIQDFSYIGMATNQDLEIICTKSSYMERCTLLDFFTADAVINFIKNGSFADRVEIRFNGIIGLAKLLLFVKSTKNFKFTNWTCSFEYRESLFQIFWYNMANINNAEADDNGAAKAG